MKKIIFLFAALIAFGTANAQLPAQTASSTVSFTIPETALIQVSGTATFQFSAPAAGANFGDASASGVSLQYTSMPAPTKTRTIYVTALSTGAALTKGLNLFVKSAAVPVADQLPGGSNGFLGTASATPSYIVKSTELAVAQANTGVAIASSINNQKLITGILACYTGTAAINGPQLTYTASVGSTLNGNVALADYQLLRSGVYNFTVYYTLADNV